MPTPTTRLRARLIDSGTELNAWGGNLNTQVFSLFDEAIAGVEKITLTGSTYTLTSTNYASDQARNAALIFQGSPAAPVTVAIPAVEKVYVCSNQTGQLVTLTAGGLTVTLAAGDRVVVWCDGTDCGLGSISAQTVNGLILAASLAPGTLPGQSGNSGKFLQTDGTAPLWSALPDVGGGADATLTTSTALNASASVVQSVDMAANAQSITLPAAPSLTKGGRKFVFVNAGGRTFGIRDNAGALLTAVPAGAVAELHLYSNSTAAGGWGISGRGLEPALTLVDHTAPTTITGAVEAAVRLTDSLSIHFGTTATGFAALAVDNSAGAAGTWTAVETGGAATVKHAFMVSATSAIIFWIDGSSNHKAAVLTVSGTTVSVGTAASTATAYLADVTFTGLPVLVQLTASLYIALYGFGATALAISVSGATVTLGSGVATGASGGQKGLAVYRVSDTAALALYIDNTGSAGSPYSIRAAVLSVSGTTVTAGASNGINDISESALVSTVTTCQLSATKYLVALGRSSPAAAMYAAAFTVSGTSVSVGSLVQASSTGVQNTAGNSNRFQPNLYAIDGSRALLTWNSLDAGNPSHHVVLTESGGAVTAGTILYSLWSGGGGGNFPQTPAGFLAFSTTTEEQAIFSVTINGAALSVTGTLARGDISPYAATYGRFGLSGGVCGFLQAGVSPVLRYGVFQLVRFRPNSAPQYLGSLSLNDMSWGASPNVPVEVAANKAAIISGQAMTQPAATGNNVRLQIIEFATQ